MAWKGTVFKKKRFGAIATLQGCATKKTRRTQIAFEIVPHISQHGAHEAWALAAFSARSRGSRLLVR